MIQHFLSAGAASDEELTAEDQTTFEGQMTTLFEGLERLLVDMERLLLLEVKFSAPRDFKRERVRRELESSFLTEAELIFTTTTPVPADYPPGSRTEKNVVAYNAAAKEIAQSLGNVAINDLHGAIVAACPKTYPADGNCSALQWPKGVHFVHAGSE